MKRLLVELENLPEAGKKYSGELDSEIFGIDDEEVTSIGPLAFDLQVQRFENELFVRGKISAPFKFRCVRCLGRFDYVVEVEDFASSFEIDNQTVARIPEMCGRRHGKRLYGENSVFWSGQTGANGCKQSCPD